jgi:hypothetical protein
MCWRRATVYAGAHVAPARSRWYGGLAVRGSRLRTVVVLGALGLPASVVAGGCGGAQQDAHEPRGSFTVRVTGASFPVRQAVSRPVALALSVRNTSARTLPDVTVAVNSFSYLSTYPHLAARSRPIWIVDEGPGPLAKPPVETVQIDPPGGGTTATANVWALGALAPGASRRFVWHVTPVKPGIHTVSYRVYAGLNGRAQAQLANGGAPTGSFVVAVARRPPQTHVDPETGRVVPGPYVPTEQ